MEIVLYIVLLLVGFAALIKGADWFVDGSSGVARLLRVPGVIIGLTIVAMGTSAPELAVTISAAAQGANEIALSNVVGSNIFNTLVVLGVCAIIRKVPVDRAIIKRDFPFSIIVSIATLAVVGFGIIQNTALLNVDMSENVGVIGRVFSIILLVVFIAYMVMLVILARKNKTEDDEAKNKMPVWKCIIFIIIGLACIIIGGQLVVNNAKEIAAAAGMSETLIGLTVVALGTSLPELVTSAVASKKGENGLAIGNVVGSNIFNLMLILGVSGAINPIAVNLASVFDLAILIVVSILAYIFARSKNDISRGEGIVLVLLYAADMVFAIMR